MNRSHVDQYVAGAAKPAQAIAGLSREQLNAFPVPGTWSIQQIVIHLMDSDLIGADRMKRVAAENRVPTLIGYDETAFAKELFYGELDPRDPRTRQLLSQLEARPAAPGGGGKS